jgi:riboflavin biosynthesis pyrimidine reductase
MPIEHVKMQQRFVVILWLLVAISSIWMSCCIYAFTLENYFRPFLKNKFSDYTTGSVSRYRRPSIEHGQLRRCANRNEEGTTSSTIPQNNVQGITLKLALDMNGGVACRSEIRPERFTCSQSLDMVHRLRANSDAVVIGIGTAISDNPSLLVRRPNITITKQPLRVVIDPMLKLLVGSQYHTYQLFTDGYPLILYHCRNDTETNEFRSIINTVSSSSSVQLRCIKPMESNNCQFLRISAEDIVHDLQNNYNVQHIMIEGGPNTAHTFLQSKLIDRCILVHAPIQFPDPILSNITPCVLEAANLLQLGSIPSGVDTIECWSRPNVPWPTSDLQDWP